MNRSGCLKLNQFDCCLYIIFSFSHCSKFSLVAISQEVTFSLKTILNLFPFISSRATTNVFLAKPRHNKSTRSSKKTTFKLAVLFTMRMRLLESLMSGKKLFLGLSLTMLSNQIHLFLFLTIFTVRDQDLTVLQELSWSQ